MLTPSIVDELLACYETMALAARANDWERLAALEREAAALRDAAREGADGITRAAATPATTADHLTMAAATTIDSPRHMGDLPAAEAESLRASIERILVLDAEIRTHAAPFLASVRKLLAGARQERAVRNAYRALAP